MTCFGSLPVAFAALLLIGAPSAEEAQAEQVESTVATLAPDTVPQGSGLLGRRILFSPEYLNRLIEAQRRPPTVAVAIEPPTSQALAPLYARRYGISEALSLQIIDSAIAEGLDPELGFRLVRVESLFRPNARGPSGSLGLTQLMPGTARAIDRTLRTDAEILDPATNLRTGFRYLKRMIDRYDGDVRLGVLAYNRGENAVDRALDRGQDPENGYSSKVLGQGGNRYTGSGVVAPEN
jgi:soluble lytic murein transglycosylase-like protein